MIYDFRDLREKVAIQSAVPWLKCLGPAVVLHFGIFHVFVIVICVMRYCGDEKEN